jgi:hypothetical protein
MRVLLLLLLLMPSLVHAQVGDGVAVCCGATTKRPDLPGRTDGFAHNLPPLDSVRFGQQFRERDIQMQTVPETRHEAPSTYPPSFGLYNLDEGGYNPQTGIHSVKPPKPLESILEGIEWPSERRAKRGQRP